MNSRHRIFSRSNLNEFWGLTVPNNVGLDLAPIYPLYPPDNVVRLGRFCDIANELKNLETYLIIFYIFQVKLERILGLTVPNNAGLASAPSRGIVAYPAGCTVVLYYTRKNRQSHIINASRKTITSLAFSEDGRYLVTGECGHAPCVRIWDVQEKQQISGMYSVLFIDFVGISYVKVGVIVVQKI